MKARTTIKLILSLSLLLPIFPKMGYSQEDTTDLYDMNLEQLMNIEVVSASKKSQKIKDAPSIISVIGNADIEKYGAVSLIDVLNFVPTVETSMGIDGHYRVSIRGTRKDGTILVMVDGNAVNDFYDGRSIYDMPTEFIDRIEIIRGPGSALFGTNAVVGIISIFTSNNDKEVKVKGGTNQTGGVYASYGIDKETTKFSVSAGYMQTGGANVNPYSEPLDNTDVETNRNVQDAYLSTNFSHKNLSIGVFGTMHSFGSWVGPFFDPSPDSELNNDKLMANITYTWKLSEKLTLIPKIYSQFVLHDYLMQEHPDGYTIYNQMFTDGAFTNEKYNGSKYGGDLQLNFDITEKWGIISGLVFENFKMDKYDVTRNYKIAGPIYLGNFANHDNVSLNQNGKQRNVAAYYLQTDYTLNKIGFVAGFRYDKYNDFGETFNPRGGIIWHPADFLTVKALYGQAFRAPTFKELYDKTSESDNAGIIGNENLKPENIKSSEMSIQYTSKRILASIAAFYNINSNIISPYDPGGTGQVGQFKNIGSVNTYGFEFETTVIVTDFLNFYAGYSQYLSQFTWADETEFSSNQDYIDKGEGIPDLFNMPNIRANGGFQLKLLNFNIFLGASYGNASKANRLMILESYHKVDIPSYVLGNASISYTFKKIKFSVSGVNLGQEKFSDPDESVSIDRMGTQGMRQPGMTILGTIAYKFN